MFPISHLDLTTGDLAKFPAVWDEEKSNHPKPFLVMGTLGSSEIRIDQTVEKGPSVALRWTASLQRTSMYASARRSDARLASGTFLPGL